MMHPATVPPPQPPPVPASPTETLEKTIRFLDLLLPSTLSVTCFASKWQVIRSKLVSLKSILSEVFDSPHWSENPLVLPLIHALFSTVYRVRTLCDHCCDVSFSCGKLLMQSDLDMATGWLTKQMNDLDLLLRSGVLRQSTAIVLSRPVAGSSKEDLTFFIKDLFTRIQIGGLEFKRKALDSLIQILSEDDKSANLVANEGNVSCLISLLDLSSHDSVRELAVVAVSLLAAAGDFPRRCVFEEGALGPLLKIIECCTMSMKEKASIAIEIITADPDNAWAISAYGGVPILVELCRSGSLAAQSHAIGAIRNVSTVEDVRTLLAEERAIPVLMQLLATGNPSAQGKTAGCISILASTSEYFCNLLLQEKALQRLLHLFHECTAPDTIEHILRAIHSLSAADSSYRILSGSTTFIMQISELITHGNYVLQHICASLLAKLSISDDCKKAMGGCMGSLVKLMESVKPDGVQEVGAKALLLLLSVKSNRKELVRDEKSLMRLVQMLDPKEVGVTKKFPVAVVSAIMAGGSQGCRKKLVAVGTCVHLQKLVEMDVPGAKKALQRLSGNRLTSLLARAWRD